MKAKTRYGAMFSAAFAAGLIVSAFAPAWAAVGGLADSASKVDVSAALADAPGADGSQKLRVRLDIAPGWHVNANPASLELLVPTTVKAKVAGDPADLAVDYPDGHPSGIVLAGQEIMVYNSGATITATLSPDAAAAARRTGSLQVVVRVQSCSNQGLCLPPASIVAPVK